MTGFNRIAEAGYTFSCGRPLLSGVYSVCTEHFVCVQYVKCVFMRRPQVFACVFSVNNTLVRMAFRAATKEG